MGTAVWAEMAELRWFPLPSPPKAELLAEGQRGFLAWA